MLKKLLTYIISLASVLTAFAQTTEIDSLKQLLYDTPDVGKKIEAYYLLSRKHHTIDLQASKTFARQGLNLSRSSGHDELSGNLYRSLGDIAVKEDSIDLARTYFLRAYNIFEQQGDFSNLVSAATVLGNIEWVSDRLSGAMNYYLEAIALAEEHGVDEYLAVLYLNIGVINTEFNNHSDALENFSKALDMFIAEKDSMNIGMSYNNMGGVYATISDTTNARHYYLKAIEIFKKISHFQGLASSNSGIASLEMMNGNFGKARDYLFTALEYVNEQSRHYYAPTSTTLAPIYNRLGNCYINLADIPEALRYFNMALQLGLQNHRLTDVSEATKGLAEAWEKQGRLDSSYHYFKIFKAYSDSLSNEESIKQLAYLDARYKYEQSLNREKEQRLRETQKRKLNNLVFGLVIGALLMVIALMVLLLKLWRNRAIQSKLEQQALKSELELRNKELTTHVMYQVKKNEFILSISKKLQSNLYKLKPENRKVVEDVIRDLESDSGDDAWEEFETRFHRVHTDFNKKLLDRFPDLSANDLRLCAFLKLNMNTKEIAAITYQTTNSIDTARSRLRQKLGISKDDNLVAFLNQF